MYLILVNEIRKQEKIHVNNFIPNLVFFTTLKFSTDNNNGLIIDACKNSVEHLKFNYKRQACKTILSYQSKQLISK